MCVFFAGMRFSFGEDDIGIREGEGNLRVVVTSRGLYSGNVTVEVLPMTLSQFTAAGTPLPHSLSASDDPAEEGNSSYIVIMLIFACYL